MFILWLFLLSLWFILSGYLSTLPLLPGLLSLFILLYLYHRAYGSSVDKRKPSISLIKLLGYVPYLIKEIIVSNFAVMKAILTNNHFSIVIRVNNPFITTAGEVLFTNSVILTPGTIVLHFSDDEFLIHMFNAPNGDTITYGTMIKKIKSIENQESK